MKQIQSQILNYLDYNPGKYISISKIALVLKKDPTIIELEIKTLYENGLLEIVKNERGKIKRIKQNPRGTELYLAKSSISDSINIKAEILKIKSQMDSVEKLIEDLKHNPTSKNKTKTLDNLNTLQSLINGSIQLIKSSIDIF